MFEIALFDQHHSVRNVVIGSLKKMGQVNPQPILCFAKKFLHHPEVEIHREVIHGIELRGESTLRKYFHCLRKSSLKM